MLAHRVPPTFWLALLTLLASGSFLRADLPPSRLADEARDQGRQLQKEARYQDALTYYDTAKQLGSKDHHIDLWIGQCQLGLKETDKAIAQFTHFINELGLEKSCRRCMRSAYGGRATAYQARGDYAKARDDWTMVLLYCTLELDILGDKADNDLRREADDARRLRDNLPVAAKPADMDAGKVDAGGRVRLVNTWSNPVSVVLEGVTYQLEPGTQTEVTRSAGDFTYEVLGAQSRKTTRLGAGEILVIRVHPQ